VTTMTITRSLLCTLLLVTVAAAQARAQSFPLTDAKGLTPRDATIEPVEVFGRKAIKVTTDKPECFAFAPNVEFQDGTIEVDLAVKTTAPPGVRMPGFLGIAFRATADGSAYDMFYVRPGNARADDQAMRNHVVQYVAAPGFGWYDLRRGWPWVYEAHAPINPEAWTHLRIEVAGRSAKLFIDRSPNPILIVDGLKGQSLRGAVALWSYPNEEAYFSNLKITSATPQPLTNGTDVAGTWDVALSTDYGPFKGTMDLRRDGGAVKGTWSGDLGTNLPVAGTWRDGYVELTFTGVWRQPPNAPQTAPQPAVATIAGWFDGSAGKGRAKVESKADGVWTATKKN
jgi:hypothetical protein